MRRLVSLWVNVGFVPLLEFQFLWTLIMNADESNAL